MIGSTGVGKSCLLLRYAKNEFVSSHSPTVGMEFFSKRISVNDIMIKLQIWDTAGQETFKSIVRNFYKGSHAVFLVYSITDRKSFQDIEEWLGEARENAPENAVFVLIGTQKDQEQRREVGSEEGREMLEKHQMLLFFETSAKSDENVDLAFEETAKTIMVSDMFKKSVDELSSVTLRLDNLDNFDEKESSTCC